MAFRDIWKVRQVDLERLKAEFNLDGRKNRDLFAAIADRYGVAWKGNKGHSHLLARRFIGEFHKDWNISLNPPKSAKKAKKSKGTKQGQYESSDPFLASYEWRKLRMEVLLERGAVCECCGADAQRDRVRMNIDHIKPRRLFPELALDKANLQVLCSACNHGKGNWDQTDWRKPRLVKKDGAA